MAPQRIDAHHHLWRYTPAEFGWIDDEMQSLRRDFQPDDLHAEATAAGVSGTIAVQARQTIEETEWLLQQAHEDPLIRGVVGWLPIAEPIFPRILDRFAAQPHLKGLRHVVQAEPPGFLDTPAFNTGISRLRHTPLVYDILIFARQLEEAIRFVDRHPNQSFVLDHIAKPDIASNEIATWSEAIRDLALRPNIACKISGMVTEADFHNWSPTQLKPYFDTVLEAFHPNRLMVGTDWPVLTVACTYSQWWQIVEAWIAPLTPTEQANILSATATRIYNLGTA
jgi:L-fuconolactonase